jgi:hypothetical protein
MTTPMDINASVMSTGHKGMFMSFYLKPRWRLLLASAEARTKRKLTAKEPYGTTREGRTVGAR